MTKSVVILALVAAGFCATHHASAQFSPTAPREDEMATGEVPGLSRVRVDENLNGQVPLDLRFRDLSGRSVRLRDIVRGANKPVLLNFAYHSCTTLCSMVMDAVEQGIHEVPWSVGDQYEVITVSIDPNESVQKAAERRRTMLARYGRPGADRGWHFLVGDRDAIEELTDAVGFRYFYDSARSNYAHPAVVTFLTPRGRIARYLYGIQFSPSDIRIALLEASEGRSISTTEHVLLYCYAYDPNVTGYTLVATRVMKLGGALTVLLLGGFLFAMWRRERRRSRSVGEEQRISPEAHQVGT